MQRRALIVDDEPAACEMIERVVLSAGMEVMVSNSGSQAAAFLSDEKFDLVFLDFHMAAPDGLELARQVRNSLRNRATLIILVSDDQRPSAVSVGFEAGANFLFYKPIDRRRLMQLVSALQWSIDKERRRMRRISLCHKVSLQFASEELDAETVDMSLNGMLVRAPRVLPPGSRLRLTLECTRGAKPIIGRGTVARVHGTSHMGIHLGGFSSADYQRLQDFLLPLLPDMPNA